jgi:hypothetical protein
MPDGAAVIKYEGKRGTVWRIKYRDSGPADDGDPRPGTRRLDEAEG